MIEMIFKTIGGLALFLYGMSLLSDGLKKAAGNKMRQILESMTSNPLMGFTAGMMVTALVQSSSATTVIVIGLVNAGLMTLRQAICVIIGTNVGTTATAWIVSITSFELKISNYALLFVAIGLILDVVGKSRKTKSAGQILIGFGILFLGIDFMKESFSGLKNSPAVIDWLQGLADRPLLALLGGALITMVVQSSSASIAMVQSLAGSGAFGSEWENALNIAIPFVLGCNIGTTITAQLAALRTNAASRRTAWAHTLFNVAGSVIALPLVYLGWYGKLVHIVAPWELTEYTVIPTIAVAHTLFNAGTSILFLPLAGWLEMVVTKMIRPRRGELAGHMVVLEQHLLDTPALALQQAKREIVRMAKEGKRALETAIEALMASDRKGVESTRKIEDLVDAYQFQITTYLVDLSQRQLDDEVSRELPVLLHMVNDLERVGDHAVNIAEIADRKIDQGVVFTDVASEESKGAVDEIYLMFDNVILALGKNDIQAAHRALTSENKLNRMQVQFRRHHVRRMTDGVCGAEAGVIFIDVVDNIEKIGDHLTNIAQSVIGGIQWAGVKGSMLSGEYNALVEK
ncbi:MAG: Na/Pi cotransporter family protein [Sedimentisphaerales bacterium]|nr:Na/Pi cotransporter family protein [Sedimentisphaerales bacterium]